MKKALALLFLSLATLPSLAAQRLWISGYRIGASAISANDNKQIVATNLNNEVKTDYITLDNNHLQSNAWFTASVPAGQKVVKWLAYSSSPASHNPPAQTNQFAGAETEYVWRYNTKDTADKYIVVDYEYIDYTLTYNANGGSGSMSSTTQCYTNTFNLTGNAFTKTGYTFDGWTNKTGTAFANQASVSGSSFGVTYTNETTKTANLYAKWNANSYTVTLDPRGGTVASGSVTATYDSAWPVLPTPTRDGYYFGGWYNDTSYNESTPTNSPVAITGNTTIYAKWIQRLTATFIDPIGSNTQTVYVAYGTTPAAPFTPYHSGYTFRDWSPKLGKIVQDTIYTAQYDGTQYFITYHSNFGDPEETKQIDYIYGTAKKAPNGATEFPRVGYTFGGWAASASSNQIRFESGEDIVTFSDEGDALYAIWEPIEYGINFDPNGGSGEMEGVRVKYDEVHTVTNCDFTKAGVEFIGWATNVANGAEFYAGESVSNLTAIADATVTFYAVWSEKCYVKYDANGGTGEMATQTFDAEDLPASLTSNAFEKVGYTFSGWATNETDAAALTVTYVDGKEFTTFASLPAAAGETATLYAAWQTNTYTVVFDPNCTSYTGTMADQSFVYDQAQALTVNGFTNETGLAFAGWATNQTGDVVFDDQATVSNLTAEADGTVTLHALWDVGELSKAMDCDNLYWKNFEDYASNGWRVTAAEDYTNGTCAASMKALSFMVVTVKTNGTLRFKWKATVTSGPNVVKYIESPLSTTNITSAFTGIANAWNDSGDISITNDWENSSELSFGLRFPGQNGGTCYIDQLTWTPEGSTVEPTEEDKPTISAFTATSDGFTLTADNVSASFSYQILATNELVGGDWPVMTNLTHDVIGGGFPITPKAGEPTMFYKVKVIAK